ncbi:hypothetical protein QBC34DRAFT_154043 [Podospora aff. communis PSN243]|uniref:Only prolin and serin are matching in the corresponding protein n=1 Tax=Podospora aff. communis PSN243 TaxID=3040156 RepID=A0AAV9GBT6_9PEZI|nr:hypothetical protein QBC34DRAFT_154043 [Podospora aff. communis PSN243]
MSPRLKPLILPQLVEEKRKLELQVQVQVQQTSLESEHAVIYHTHNSSSPDIASPSPLPLTPTSVRNHSRYPGSASSLASVSSESLVSPVQPVHPVHPTNKTSKSQLPDVQEEPLEREEEDYTVIPDYREPGPGLYDCLCDEPCGHRSELAQSATIYPYMSSEVDYDLGFLSDGDFAGSPRQKKRRHGSDAGLSSWGSRIGSRLTSLPRWKSSTRRNHFSFSPASDPALDQPPSFSRAASSRSSSISVPVPVRGASDRGVEPPLPATPALSFYESLESLPSPLDINQAVAGRDIERDRAMATTPLLPPLLTEAALSRSVQPSPLQSPTVAPSSATEISQTYPTPPLSTKASISSFRRGTVSSTYSEAPCSIPCLLDHDAWSDRLGHANFTIEPRPYTPEHADLATLQSFRTNWSLARVNYAKHLARTGEHYGGTSKAFALTEAKWAEVEQEWHRIEGELIQRLDPQSSGTILAALDLRRATEEPPQFSMPWILNDEKFPERGDMDIVGPMIRDAVMIRDGRDEKKAAAPSWLRNLAGKLRR